MTNSVDTRIIAIFSILALSLFAGWLLMNQSSIDALSDYSKRSGVLESAEETILDDSSGRYLDIRIQDSSIIFRIPVDGYFVNFRREAFFKNVSVGENMELWALDSEWKEPNEFSDNQVIYIRGVRVGLVDYCTVQDHIAWQSRDRPWEWLIAAMFISGALVVALGFLIGRKQEVSNDSASKFEPLQFTGRGKDIFKRHGLIAFLLAISVVGIPASFVYIYRWFSKNTLTPNGNGFTFVGTIPVSYGISMAGVFIQLTEKNIPFDKLYALFETPFLVYSAVVAVTLLFIFLQGVVSFMQFNYFVDNQQMTNGKRLNSTVPLLAFGGFYILFLLSLFTVIGWAWVSVWFYRWQAVRVKGEGIEFRFVGTGFQYLWRGIAALVASIPLITIPWTMAWFARWWVSSLETASTKV